MQIEKNAPLVKIGKQYNYPFVYKRYLPGLDSLRAIAALSVCLFHFTNGGLPKVVIPSVKGVFEHGVLGVVVFFVISGFIIPYSLLDKNHQVQDFFTYLKKRIIRINPPAYAALLLVLGQWYFIDKVIQHGSTWTQGVTAGRIAANALFIVPFTEQKWIVGVFWTLAIEFEFYIFIGVLFSIMFERRRIGWFLGIYIAASLAWYLVPALATDSFPQYASVFALGGATLLWQQQRISLAVYAGCMLLFTGLAYWQMGIHVAGVALATALAIDLLKVSIPGLGFLGRISYSFYLLHLLIGTTCEFFLIRFITPTTTGHKLLITGLAIIISVGAAYVFNRLIEQPFMRLASRQR